MNDIAADAVDLVVLGPDLERHESGGFATARRAWAVDWEAPLADLDARRVLALWPRVLALPPAEQMRCHLPAFGLRLRRGGVEVARIAPCFECHNVSAWSAETGDEWLRIDGASPPARALLELLVSLLPRVHRWRVVGPGEDRLPDGWDKVAPDRASRLVGELHRELAPEHPLFQRDLRACAARRDRDDVLYVLPDGRAAVVHLTWSGGREPMPWPSTGIYANLDDFLEVDE